MPSYPNLLLEPEGRRRVLLLSLDGTEGAAAEERLVAALRETVETLADDAAELPFGAVIELRAGPPGAPGQEHTRGLRRSGLFLQCVRRLAAGGLAFLACVAEGPGSQPGIPGARFSGGGFLGACFPGLEPAYRWLDARLSRSRTVPPTA